LSCVSVQYLDKIGSEEEHDDDDDDGDYVAHILSGMTGE